MPTQKAFGSKTAMDSGSGFVQLKKKGEKVQFRFIAPPSYDGKHFKKVGDKKWDITMCPKVMTEEYCELCDTYYKMMAEAKAMEDENAKKAKQEEARNFKSKVTFYYPILDREDGKAKILKTTLSVRLKVDEKTAMGKDVTKNDYILMRTEKPGTDYYSLEPVDSADSNPLSTEELEQIEVAKTWDMEEKIETKVKQSSEEFAREVGVGEPATEEATEAPNPEDMPF